MDHALTVGRAILALELSGYTSPFLLHFTLFYTHYAISAIVPRQGSPRRRL